MARPEWIEVGRVSRPHGVGGEVRVIPDTDNPERFAEGEILHARQARKRLVGGGSDERLMLTIREVRGAAGYPIVSFVGVDDRDAAEALRGSVLEIPGERLPRLPSDEYYPFDLEGLTVRVPSGDEVGRVTEVIEAPAHPLLSVSLASGEQVLVPFVMAAVPTVSVDEGFVVIEPAFLERP